ncbi:MAG: NosD domain-containing protein [Candidatus Heimdallarchaeaceae archaeon]
MIKGLLSKKSFVFASLTILLVSAISIPLFIIYLNLEDSSVICSNAEICIDSDDDFKYYGFEGDGTKNYPYLIENRNFANQSQQGIFIANTTSYFTIQNCIFNSSNYCSIVISDIKEKTAKIINNSFLSERGIRINRANSTYITDNCFDSFDIALIIEYSSNCNVSNNYFYDSLIMGFDLGGYIGLGIIIYYTENTTIANNEFSSTSFCIKTSYANSTSITNNSILTSGWGIEAYKSINVTISNNRISNSEWGIFIFYSKSSIIENNTCSSCHYGIYTNCSPYSLIKRNNCTNTGFYIYNVFEADYETYRFSDNLVNGKKLGYYVQLDNCSFVIPDYGQLIFVSCDNLLIANQSLSNSTFGLIFYYCRWSTIINNTFDFNYSGISLRYSGYSELINNTFRSNTVSGIGITSSTCMSIINNTVEQSIYGIALHQVLLTNITANRIIQNEYGIIISSNCEVNTISFNIFLKNKNNAINIGMSSNINFIHHNSFFNNNENSTSQAYDSGSGNYWYDTLTLEGNYWSDWNQTNGYLIGGSSGSTDPYPLLEPPNS